MNLFTEIILAKYLKLPRFVQNVSFVILTQTIIFFSGGISSIIIARFLGPEGKGIYDIVVLVPWMLFLFCSFGVGVSVIYFTGLKKYSYSEIIGNISFLATTIIILFGTIYFMILPFISEIFLKNIEIKYLKISFFIFPFMLVMSYFGGLPQGLQQIKKISMIDIIKTLTNLIFIFVFVILCKLRIVGATLSTTISFLLGAIFAIYLVIKIHPFVFKINLNVIKNLILFGLKNQFNSLIGFLNARLGLLLINFFLLPKNVGIYSIAILIAELLLFIPNAFSRTLLPKIANSDLESANLFTPQVCRTSIFISVVSSVIMLIFGKYLIILVFTEKYMDSFLSLLILLPGIICMGVSTVLSSDIIGRGKPIYVSYSSSFSLVITVIADILLIPKLGVPGAALASTLSNAINAIAISIFYKKFSGNSLGEFLIVKKEDFILYKKLILFKKV